MASKSKKNCLSQPELETKFTIKHTIDLKTVDNDFLGEIMRSATFVGNGYGGYDNFRMRTDAKPMDYSAIKKFLSRYPIFHQVMHSEVIEHGRGYTFTENKFTIYVLWYGNGNGELAFVIKRGEKLINAIINNDCIHDQWMDIDLQ